MSSYQNGEREVLDPITHLPLVIYDMTDIELEQILPPLYTAEEHRRASASASASVSATHPAHPQHHASDSNLAPTIAETNRHHKATDRLVHNLTQKGWWSDPGADLERFRVQAAFVAGGTAGFGAIIGLFSWWLLGFLLSRQIFSFADLFILPLGCCLLGLGVGVITVSFKPPPTQAQSRSPSRKLESYPPARERDKQFDSIVPSLSRPPSPRNSQPRETSLSGESPEWLNSLLRSIWPIVNPALFTSIATTLEDSLQHSLPKLVHGVRIADIGQGVEPVRILGVQFLSPDSASQSVHGLQAEEGDYMNLEVAFAYRSQPTTSAMGLKGRSANLHMLMEFYTSGGIDMPVWVELTGLLGAARMRIELTPNPPFVARIILTLLGQPKVTMNCIPLAKNSLNVMDVPVLSSWLQHNVDSVVAEYVAPKSMNLDLQGVPKVDVDALGVIVVTIRYAAGFKDADHVTALKAGDGARERDVYVTVGWSKWGKFLWATRIINRSKNPKWEETTAILVNPQEVDAQEALRIQAWGANHITADDLIGTVDVPLSELMHSSKSLNRITIREDQFCTDTPTAKPLPGKIMWECGYFEKTTLEQHMEYIKKDQRQEEHDSNSRGAPHDVGSYEQVKARIEAEAEGKFREVKTREIFDRQIYLEGEHDTSVSLRSLDQPAAGVAENAGSLRGRTHSTSSENKPTASEVEQQISKSNELIASSSPSSYFLSGILGIRIEQISGLGVQKVRETGIKDVDDEDENDLPSAYCEVLINHQRVYKTRTKMKSSNPFFDAKTEKFIRSWESTNLIVAVRDNRLHEHSPILGVVILPLTSVLRRRSHFQNTLPIVGGVGYGRLKLELIFRSVQARLPKRLLGWDIGTLEINPWVFAVPSAALRNDAVSKPDSDDENRRQKEGGRSASISSDLAGCRLVFLSRYSKGKMFPFHPTHYRSLPGEQSQLHKQHSERGSRPPTSNTTESRLSGSVSSTSSAVPTIEPQNIVPLCPSAFEQVESMAEAEWRPKYQSHAQGDALKPLRLPILKRYACCIHILFRRSSHLGRGTTLARSVLWLKDIPDEEEVVVLLPIRRERSLPTTGSTPVPAQDLPSRAQRKTESQLSGLDSSPDHADEIVPEMMLALRLRFWRGLSGYHQSLVSQSSNLEDVTEILDCAEDQEDINAGMINSENSENWSNKVHDPAMPEEAEQEDGDDDSDGDDDDGVELSVDSRELVQPGDFEPPSQGLRTEKSALKKHEFISDAQAQRKKPKESHRKHRGLMQWKYMRQMAWVRHEIEHKAEKLGRKVKSGFKHQDRDAGAENEV